MTKWTDAPVDGSDTHVVEYLYTEWGTFRITKKTAKRFYYVKSRNQIGFVGRHQIAEDWPPTWRALSDLRTKLGRDNVPAFFLKPRPPGFYDRQPLITDDDLRKLKAAMAAAHPDRGGSDEAFIEARAAYEEARYILKVRAAEAQMEKENKEDAA